MLFSHDGIHDSQTHLASPSYFYEQLRREIALAKRTQKPLALVKILFENSESGQIKAQDILHFSYELSQLVRKEECVGRLGINEVVIIVRDGCSNVEPFVERLLNSTSLNVDRTLHIKVSKIYAEENEDSLRLLERLDRAELVTQ